MSFVISVCMLFAVMCGDFEIFKSSAVCRLCDVVHRVCFSKFPYVWTIYCGVEALNFLKNYHYAWDLYHGV